jgi:hypothetical protein
MIYDIAGLRIQINNKHPYTDKFCKAYLSEDQNSPFDISATVEKEEFLAEKELSSQFSDGYIENICLYRSICVQLPKLNRMLLHAAILEYDGNAYAFLGKSGTGKSTHTGLWLKHVQGTRIVNGDKPILEYRNGKFTAYGTPWMGKEGLGEKTQAPLCGLCFLEQAPENSIKRMTAAETSARLFTQILLPKEEKNVVSTLDFVDKMILGLPSYLLKCTISEEAVQKSFEALTGKQYISKNI